MTQTRRRLICAAVLMAGAVLLWSLWDIHTGLREAFRLIYQ
jgi:hypothetical protein